MHPTFFTRPLKFLMVVISMALPGFFVQLQAQNADETAIRKVLAEQVVAWNNGDVSEFMKGYWNNDSLLFIGKAGPKYGYNTALDNYKKNYPGKSAMGTLRFDLFRFNQLSDKYYFVAGKFHLTRTIGDLEGHFTLVFRKINNQWLIISDHSS